MGRDTVDTINKDPKIGTVPSDWRVISVGELFDFKNGLNKSKEFFGKGTPIVNYMDVYTSPGLIASDVHGEVTVSTSEIRNYEVRKGDVFFTRTSETVEEIGMSSVMLEDIPDAVFSGFVLRGRPKNDSLDDLFKKYIFRSEATRKQITSGSSYTTRALTNGRLLSKVLVPLPPTKTEQTAIGTALNKVDALIQSLEKIIAKKRLIKQGAMQELLRPKKGWKEKAYGQIFEFLSTATYSRAELSSAGKIGYIHYGDIHTKWNHFLDVQNSGPLPSIDEEKAAGYSFLENGDLIIVDASEDYSGINKGVEVKNLGDRRAISGLHTFLLRDTRGIFIDGFRGYIHSSDHVKTQFDRVGTGMKVFGVSKTNLKSVLIPIPPKEEQFRIATILMDMDIEIDDLENKLEKYRMIKQGMMQNLLTGKIRLV